METEVKSAPTVVEEGTGVSKAEPWALVVEGLEIPAGKLVAVVGQVCRCHDLCP